jgi:transcriptional regulator with XRE-family HTH domain
MDSMNDTTQLIDKLARQYMKPSYTATAEALGITKSYLSKLRSGDKSLTPELREKIERLLPHGDTTSELRQQVDLLLDKLIGEPVDELTQSQQNRRPEMTDAILALLAAQKQRWETAARIDELQHTIATDDSQIFYTPDPSNPRFGEHNDIRWTDRINELQAALDGVIGGENE